MNTLREAARQALEAYDQHEPLAVVMDALRAALAEPVQEPVAWLFTNLQSGGYDFCYQEDEHDHDREMWHKQPLYPAPLQRKPLTDEEIKEVAEESGIDTKHIPRTVLFIARAIEQAHGIKP